MILYIFITCQKRLKYCHDNIKNMMTKKNYNDYLIVVGGHDVNNYNEFDKILELSCNDFYEGLPEKVVKTYQYIHTNTYFNKYTHFCKLDDDMILTNIIDSQLLCDYGGVVCSAIGNRKWHIGKCSETSHFNTKQYEGIYVPWCLGGTGYLLSRLSIGIISNANIQYTQEIYEDLAIAKILFKNNIQPKNIENWSSFVFSEDHS